MIGEDRIGLVACSTGRDGQIGGNVVLKRRRVYGLVVISLSSSALYKHLSESSRCVDDLRPFFSRLKPLPFGSSFDRG